MEDVDGSEWWRSATVYQIYPLSYADANGDGFGDLQGIIDHLGHLAGEADSLGVDAIWLSPIYRSPMVDFGYDVADHCAVDPRLGSIEDADALIRAAHARGLRVLLDFVPNHTSDQHEWFEQARRSRTDPKRDWYVWADPAPDGGPPNNWLSAFERVGRAWTFDEATGQYYLHSYTPQQPDLNWREPAVRAAMHDVMRFWLDRGVDGFRVDAPHRLGKDELLSDNAPDVVDLRVATQLDERRHRNLDDQIVHEFLRELRTVIDSYPDRVLIGEVGVHHPVRRRDYYGAGDELQMVFDFGFWSNPWQADAFRRSGGEQEAVIEAGGWATHALSNHDLSRHASRYAVRRGRDGMARARAAAVLLTTLPGTTFLYYGEEIGMTDVPVPADRATDPDGRDPERTPMQWDFSLPAAGFSTARPWLPVPGAGPDVRTQSGDPGSLLSLYRDLLRLRRDHPGLRSADYADLDAGADVYAFRRSDGLLVAINFSDTPREAALLATSNATVVLSTGARTLGAVVDPRELVLEPNEAVVLAARH
ncbi:MAG TPA: alpha-amylase family glycosyl hydrolase [Jatrophihabitans sp.]